MPNRSTFETHHPFLASVVKTAQYIVYTTALKIGKNLAEDLSKYIAQQGTSVIEDTVKCIFISAREKSGQENNNCQPLDQKGIELEGIDSSTQTTTIIEQ